MFEIYESLRSRNRLIKAWCPVCDREFKFSYNQPVFCPDNVCRSILPNVDDLLELISERKSFYLECDYCDEPLEDW